MRQACVVLLAAAPIACLNADVSARWRLSAAVTRRSVLGSLTTFIAAPALADGISTDFVRPPPPSVRYTNPDVERERARLADPFAAAREQNPTRSQQFVDELPPLDPAERQARQRAAAEQIFRGENTARPEAKVSKQAAAPAAVDAPRLDDEFTLEFDPSAPVGVKLKDLRVGCEYGTTGGTSRVLVSDVLPGGQAAASGRVEIDNIVVAVDGVNVEKERAQDVQARLARAKAEGRPIKVTFKDALAFNEKLSTVAGGGKDRRALEPISTKVAPGSESEAEQVLSIRRLEVPDRCTRVAQSGDLVEIRYTGRLADGTLFDGMELADRLGDDSIQFVLGRQPAGQFPPSWDVGLVGMCVGERRVLDVPPVLGYGAKGLPKRGVPPNARLVYDVELLAINALSTP